MERTTNSFRLAVALAIAGIGVLSIITQGQLLPYSIIQHPPAYKAVTNYIQTDTDIPQNDQDSNSASQISVTSEIMRTRMIQSYGKIPLGFERNNGQCDQSVKYISRGNGYALLLKEKEAVLLLSQSSTRRNE